MLSKPSVVAELVAKARQSLPITLNWKEKFIEDPFLEFKEIN